ncbi:MAG TPA: acyloxyacyl hydrolase, partial [Tenuifilaceae bacterium]|nr:acyloxyacyl hydrolase [Tenuifilaceae bacterium]
MKRIVLVCFSTVAALILSTAKYSNAQIEYSHSDFRFIDLFGQTGTHIYTGELLKEALSNGYGALQVRYGWQSNTPDSWQSKYLYPGYGVGWYSGFIGNPDLLGKPSALFGFISFPLFNNLKHTMLTDVGLGISFGFEPYHEVKNELNDAIGSRFNAYFNLKLVAKYRINRELDFIYGLDFTHFSNGRTFRPNAGLNMYGTNLGFRYNFNAKQKRVDNSYLPKKILDARPELYAYNSHERIGKGELLIYGAYGFVQNSEDMGTDYQYSTVTSCIEYRYLLNTRSGFTAGFDFFYDASLKPYFPNKTYDFYGIHAGYDFMFWNFSIRIQGGSYLTAK